MLVGPCARCLRDPRSHRWYFNCKGEFYTSRRGSKYFWDWPRAETSTANRSESSASSYYDPDEDGSGIDRHRLDPDEARTHFLPAGRNRRNLGLADRIDGKRKQYRDISRRARQEPGEFTEDFSITDEDEESLERKIARLRQEVSEIKGEFERRRAAKGENGDTDSDGENTVDALCQVLDSTNGLTTSGAGNRMMTKLSKGMKSYDNVKTKSPTEPLKPSQDGLSLSFAQQSPVLPKVADFDARLALIETVMGIDTIPLPTQERQPTRAVFPFLEQLDRQIATLSTSTDSSLDSVSRRVRQLTQDTQRLGEAGAAAKAAQEGSNGPRPPLAPDGESKIDSFIEDPKHVSKINALYGTLPTIESLAPLLPAVLDRLRSLQTIHVDAAGAGQNLEQLETRQEAMAQELKTWREGLETVERKVKEGEKTTAENTTVVETWVKELEKRMDKFRHWVSSNLRRRAAANRGLWLTMATLARDSRRSKWDAC